jgi:hypothetical protein
MRGSWLFGRSGTVSFAGLDFATKRMSRKAAPFVRPAFSNFGSILHLSAMGEALAEVADFVFPTGRNGNAAGKCYRLKGHKVGNTSWDKIDLKAATRAKHRPASAAICRSR